MASELAPLPHGLHEAIAGHRSQHGGAQHGTLDQVLVIRVARLQRHVERGLKGLDILGQLLERHHPLVVRQPLLRRHLRGHVELGHHTAVGGHGLLRSALHFLRDDVLSKRGGVVLDSACDQHPRRVQGHKFHGVADVVGLIRRRWC